MYSPGFDNVAYEGARAQMNKTENTTYYEVPVSSSPPVKNTVEAKFDGLKSYKKCIIALTVTVAVMVLVGIAVCTGFAVEIAKLKTEKASDDRNFAPPQKNLGSEFFNFSYRQSIVENAPFYSELIKLLENSTMLGQYTISSCTALPPSSPSGYYWVSTFTGPAVRVYCDMTRSCGGVTGGWMRVAHLDMTDSSQQCPSGLSINNDTICTCVINTTDSSGACSQITISSNGLHYSRVCGRIKAYQVGSPDTIGNSGRGTSLSIGDNYVDGVSLTHGNPRQHIWTFAAGLDEVATFPKFNCPCTNINRTAGNPRIPSFVGDDYFCDTGSSGRFVNGFFYSSDPLWDGAGCGPMNTCCSFNTPPWFYKQLPQPTTDDIEMRVCRDQPSTDEDIAIERIDIFVR